MNRAREGEFKRESGGRNCFIFFCGLILIFEHHLPARFTPTTTTVATIALRRRKCPMMCPKVVFQAIEGSHAGVIDGLSEGFCDGRLVGLSVGIALGKSVGVLLGVALGRGEGFSDGCAVGSLIT